MSVIQGLIGSTLLRARVRRPGHVVVVASLLSSSLLDNLELLKDNLESRRPDVLSPPPLITVKMERKASSDQSRLF